MLYPGAALSCLGALEAIARAQKRNRAGVRLCGSSVLVDLLASGLVHRIAAEYLGAAAHPVRAILFDKTPETNWSLGWHQDRTIAVIERHNVPGFGPWTVKHGILHVAPPFGVIARMTTMRIHFDDVPADNAPLLVSPGSHRIGLVPEARIAEVVARLGVHACLAARGDIWVYATPILHASAAATGARHRRVLQVDYAAEPLPGGLEWRGI